MTKLAAHVNITDCNGVVWIWNGEFIWVEGSEGVDEGSDTAMALAGYYCESLDEAFRILREGGWLSMECSED